MDALFLYAESEEAPMTVGCVAVFEGRVPLRRFINMIESKLHFIPRYRQKVVPAPFNAGLPTWEYDPDFDIDDHIHLKRLKKPGTEEQLYELSEKIFQGKLEMDKPLWEIHIVHGLEGGKSALIVRAHHSMIDGIAGIGLMLVIFDAEPDPPKVRKEPYNPEPIPERSALLYDALWDNAIEGVKHWATFQRSINLFGKGKTEKQVVDSVKEFGKVFLDLLMPSQRFFFNKAFSGKRKFAFSECSFSEARAIRHACAGSTVNDIALCVLGGAMTRYLHVHGQSTEGLSLQVIVPVNIREEVDDGAMGNRITFLPVKVPLDVSDPLKRLKAVTETTRNLKESRVADSVNLLFNLLQGTPPALQKIVLNTLAAPQMQGVMGLVPQMPPGNLICTNVPGPQIPLYTVGRRMLKYYPLLPITLEMGISCGITSYDQKLYFTFMADGNCARDIHVLRDFHLDEFEALREAAAVDERQYVQIKTSMEPGRNGPSKKPVSRRGPERAVAKKVTDKPADN